MEYRRYSLASFGEVKWIRCNECSTPDEPCYVWEGRDRSANFELVVGAVMQHEIAAHASRPKRRS